MRRKRSTAYVGSMSLRETPQRVGGLQMWLDGRDPVLTTSNGVTSRNGALGPIVFGQVTPGFRPAYVPNVGVWNGRAALQFDGIDDWLTGPSGSQSLFTFLHSGLGMGYFLGEYVDATGPTFQAVLATRASTGNVAGIAEAPTTSSFVTVIGNGTALVNNMSLNAGAHYGRNVARWRGSSHANAVRRSYVSGQTLSNPDVGGILPTTTPPTITLRFGNATGSTIFKGFLPQFIAYNREPDAGEWAALADWFGKEYGFAVLDGVGGLSAANYYNTTAGMVGTAAGFWIACLIKIDSQQVASATRQPFRLSASAGAQFRIGTTNAQLTFVVYDAGVVARSSGGFNFTATELGKLHLLVGVHDGNVAHLYVARNEIGAGVACVGYAASTALNRLGDLCDGQTIFGGACGNSVPTLAHVQAYFDKVKAAGKMVPMDGVATNSVWNLNAATPTIADDYGAVPLTRVGAPAAIHHQVQWAW
jgi:hypothetical protein